MTAHKTKRRRINGWRRRRVCFLVSDHYHVIHLANIGMPVRLAGRDASGLPLYEGPVGWVWENLVSPRLNGELTHSGIEGYHLVGALVVSDEIADTGRIDWVRQSEVRMIEPAIEQFCTEQKKEE